MKQYLFGLLLLATICTYAQDNNGGLTVSERQRMRYDSLLNNYQNGRVDYAVLPFLVDGSKKLKQKELAAAIADDYINNYLLHLTPDSILTRDNINFIYANLKSSKSRAFAWIKANKEKIDQVMQKKGAADDMVCKVVSVDDVAAELLKADKETREPNWRQLRKRVLKKTSALLTDRIMLDGKIKWYGAKKKWPLYCRHIIEKVERFGPFGMFPDIHWQYNHVAWTLFLKSQDAAQLVKALKWSDSSIKLAPKPTVDYYDTYANILYKLGRVNEAIAVEEKAASMEPKQKEVIETLEKMRKGERTWPEL